MTCDFIVPVYNEAAYLATAIRSIQEQTHSFTLYVVDDGSTDSTPRLMEYFLKDKRIKYLKKKNGGPASAMDYGIKHGTGEILVFGAGDDIQLPNKVADSIEAIGDNDFGYTGYNHCNVHGEVWEYCPPKPLTKDNLTSAVSGGGLVIRRSTYERVPFRTTLRLNEDLAWTVDAYNADLSYSFKDVATYNYRLLPTGLSYKNKVEVDKITESLLSEVR